MDPRSLLAAAVRTARRLLALGLYYSGLLALWIRVALRGKTVVLTYHRVLSREDAGRTWSHPGIVVTRESFERHLQVLARHFQLISVAELADRLQRGERFGKPCCLITFDDGWRDTYTVAWPVLRRDRTPAVVFLPVDFIGSSAMFWQEHLSALLYQAWADSRADAGRRAAVAAVLDRAGGGALLDEPSASIRDAVRVRVSAFKNATLEPPATLIRELETLVGEAAAASSVDAFMGWDDVRRMAADGVAFGGHGTTHRILTTLRPEEVEIEVAAATRELQQQLGAMPLSFSYPNGNHHTVAETAVREAGYRVAFSTRPGHVSIDDDRFTLRRINVHEDVASDAPRLLARIAGVL